MVENKSNKNYLKLNFGFEPNIHPPGFTVDLQMRVRHRFLVLEVVRVGKLDDGIPRLQFLHLLP